MKKIEAFIRHEAFEPIRSELLDKGFPSLSISEAKGSGRQKGMVEAYRGSAVTVSVRPKLKLEVVVRDEDTGTVAETIIRVLSSRMVMDLRAQSTGAHARGLWPPVENHVERLLQAVERADRYQLASWPVRARVRSTPGKRGEPNGNRHVQQDHQDRD